MLLKLTGLTAVFICCAAAGFFKSATLEKRVHQLETFSTAIGLISTEIRYFASPVDVIVAKLNALDEYKKLGVFGICGEKLAKTHDFQKSWEISLKYSKSKLALNDGDLEVLLWFGRVLGTTDIEGQLANCERYSTLLSQRLDSAREDRQKRGKMYSSLGVLIGVFFVVMLV